MRISCESVDRQSDCGRVLIGARSAGDYDGVGASRSASACVHGGSAYATTSPLEHTAADQHEKQAVAQQFSALWPGHPDRA